MTDITDRIITLNDIDQRLARCMAAERAKSCAERRAADCKVGPQDGKITTLDGCGAEVAFDKLHNIYPDTEIGVTPIHDATMHNGMRVDVKQTTYPDGHLIAFKGKKDKPADFYALMIGKFPTYRYAGLMSGDEFIRDGRLTDFGYGPTYAARQDELFAPGEDMDAVRARHDNAKAW